MKQQMTRLQAGVLAARDRMDEADKQLARYYKYNPNPKPYRLNGQDITEWTIKRLKQSGVWDKV
jgi:hypothetical protein